MIFISYRREDTKGEVTHLHRRLVQRYGEGRVFVDYDDIPPGERWPDVLRGKLESCRVLLAVIGPKWGEARFTEGKKKGRLRLDDPNDWVRVEICTALRREGMRVVVVPIDDASLPETEWACDLDELPALQAARIRNQGDFERDFEQLCASLEKQVPDLVRAEPVDGEPEAPASDGDRVESDVARYVAAELRAHASIQLPLVSRTGSPVIAAIGELRTDLPLLVRHEHAPSGSKIALLFPDADLLQLYELFRGTHTSALLVDRASRAEDVRRDCAIGERLKPGSRLVVVGDPGCGKSTLLQWIAHHYGARFAASATPARGPVTPEEAPLPQHDWLPILILCRDLAGQALPLRLEDLLRAHLKKRQFSDGAIERLVPRFERLVERGRAVLLVDGLDEIPSSEARVAFCELLGSVARRFPEAPIVVTSRVVGFQAVREALAADFDHLFVLPLDRQAKRSFIERWSRLIGWGPAETGALVRQVCHRRITAKLTENIFLLAMVAQLQVLDRELPGRRVDIYRRAVELMLQRRRPFHGPPVSLNEILPHLEHLAYTMRRRGVQRCTDTEALDAFRELCRLEPEERFLRARPPEELLSTCIDSVGILNIAGTEIDARGYERQVVQFFHQSFQEYFAGRAIDHRHDGGGAASPVARLRDLLATIEVSQREVVIWGSYKVVEPVVAGYWQETLRMAIAHLDPGQADEAFFMLLPASTTPPEEARARAVFALQCLAEEPRVADATIAAVFDAAIDHLQEADGFAAEPHTWMDQAMAALFESTFGGRLRERLLDEFLRVEGEPRRTIGVCLLLGASDDDPVTPENADAMIAEAARGLSSSRSADRVRTALRLMNRFFATEGKLGFLTPSQREPLMADLVAALSADEPTQCAAVWALFHLTGARVRSSGRNRKEASAPHPLADHLLLEPAVMRRVEEALRRTDVDPITLGWGCLIATRERGLDLVAQQFDWIHETAIIADGDAPRRDLRPRRPSGRSEDLEWMKALLVRELSPASAVHVALALGSLGVFVPTMIAPLRHAFVNETGRYSMSTRDDALVYLALIEAREVTAILTDAADTPPAGEDDYLYCRGLFGLLLRDDVDVLAGQLRKALPHSDVNAYAFGLAGSRDARGRDRLDELKTHPEERVRRAVASAFARSWMTAGSVDLADAPSWDEFGRVLLRQERFDEALSAFEKAVAFAPTEARYRCSVAGVHRRCGRGVQAEGVLREATDLEPTHEPAHDALGSVLEGMERWDDAIVAFSRAAGLAPGAARYPSKIATLYRNLGRLEDAERWCRTALTISPQDADLVNNLGVTLQRQRRLDEALELYTQAMELRPREAVFAANAAEIHRVRGRIEKAEQDFRAALQTNESCAPAHAGLGRVLADLGRYDEAIAAVGRAVGLAPGEASHPILLSYIHRACGRPAEAEPWIRKALELAARNALGWLELGRVLRALARPAEALEALTRAADLDPALPEVAVTAGDIALGLDRLEDAEQWYRKELALTPDPRAHNGLGLTLLRAKRFEDARAAFLEAYRLRPAEGYYPRNVGEAYWREDRVDEAVTWFQRALELAPRFAVAHEDLAWAHARQGRPDDALAELVLAFECAPTEGRYAWRIGILHREQGRLGEAEHWGRKAVELRPRDAVMHNELGVALYKAGRHDEALACFRKASELDPGQPLYQRNVAVLAKAPS
jgi:Flp pilus assembly protein TadD